MKSILNAGLINDANLRGYWTLDQTEDTNTKLLLHLNDVDTATSTIEMTGKSVTFGGTAQMDTAQSKFGGASLLLDGNSDYITLADSADWNFGTGNFTVDMWVRFNSLSNVQQLGGQYVNDSNFWWLYKNINNTLAMRFMIGGVDKALYTTASAAVSDTNVWYHLAFVRNSTTGLIFVNGVSQSLTETTAFSTNDVGDIGAVFTLGAQGTSNHFVNGWIDEYRVVKGAAKWTANFTAPTVPHAYGPDDYVTGGYHGVGTALTFSNANGLFNQGAAFNGSSSKIVIPDTINLKPTGAFSVGGWVKVTGTSAYIMQSYSANTAKAGFLLGISGAGKLQLYVGDNTGAILNTNYTYIDSNNVINNDVWHFVVGVYDQTNIYVYIDGALDGSKAWNKNCAYAATNYVRIGCACLSGTDAAFVAGNLDDMFLFNRALTAAEIQAIYQGGSAVMFMV